MKAPADPPAFPGDSHGHGTAGKAIHVQADATRLNLLLSTSHN